MALKFIIDKLDDVPVPLREHYVKEGNQFVVATQGDHPKVAEFRSSNVELLKERDALKTKFDGIDPDVSDVVPFYATAFSALMHPSRIA